MTGNIEAVEVSIKVSLPKKLISGYKEDPSLKIAHLTDEEVIEGLVEDILIRYFNTEYFDPQVLC